MVPSTEDEVESTVCSASTISGGGVELMSRPSRDPLDASLTDQRLSVVYLSLGSEDGRKEARRRHYWFYS